MEYRWSILGGKGEEQETCFGGKKALILIKNVKEKGAKNPTLLKGKTRWGGMLNMIIRNFEIGGLKAQ